MELFSGKVLSSENDHFLRDNSTRNRSGLPFLPVLVGIASKEIDLFEIIIFRKMQLRELPEVFRELYGVFRTVPFKFHGKNNEYYLKYKSVE
jgi:hypothetical protein